MGTIWRKLSKSEEEEFKIWAKENHKPFDRVSPLWHPVIKEECAKIDQKELKKTGKVF
jgi:hypothetical protein